MFTYSIASCKKIHSKFLLGKPILLELFAKKVINGIWAKIQSKDLEPC